MYYSATLSDYSGLIEAEADLSKAFSLFTSVNFLERIMSKTWFTKHNATHRDVNTSYQCYSCPKKFSRHGWLKFNMYANILVTFGRFQTPYCTVAIPSAEIPDQHIIWSTFTLVISTE